jgi:hypothetical protein
MYAKIYSLKEVKCTRATEKGFLSYPDDEILLAVSRYTHKTEFEPYGFSSYSTGKISASMKIPTLSLADKGPGPDGWAD